MPAVGGGGVDIRSILATIINVVKSKVNHICASTCDGLILRMHYRWTFFILIGQFFIVWYSWFHREVITCVSHHDAASQVRLDYVNVCLSYPYVEEDNGARRYILFYRWISWTLLVLAGMYYIPRKVSKNLDNARCKKLLEDLAANAHRYDHSEKELVERAYRYIAFNLKTHNGLYWKYLFVNLLALAIDICTMQSLDFLLQGRFIQYGFKAFPFERDPLHFTDYMSQTFPPFAKCELAPQQMLTNQRTEKLGCHLTVMELYEKVFLALWVWLIILSFVTCCYIVFLFLMWLPCVRLYLLRTEKPALMNTHKVRGTVETVLQHCKIGDIYLLYRLKSHLSHARFFELMTRLSDPNLFSKPVQLAIPPGVTVDNKEKMSPNMQDNLRNRKPNAPQDPHLNQDYLHQLLTNPEMMVRNPQQHPGQQAPLLHKGNTSILIE